MGTTWLFLACPGYPECKSTKQFTKDENGVIQIVEEIAEVTDEVCDKCQSPMVVKRGRFGGVLGVFPVPRNAKARNHIKLGVKCPVEDCHGDLVQKRTKKGTNLLLLQSIPELQLCFMG